MEGHSPKAADPALVAGNHGMLGLNTQLLDRAHRAVHFPKSPILPEHWGAAVAQRQCNPGDPSVSSLCHAGVPVSFVRDCRSRDS